MKNDVLIKVTCLTNNNRKDEFHFDYYNKEGSIVGTVAVDENGKLGWSIWDNNYQTNILYNASYLLGEKIDNSIEYVLKAKTPDLSRWEKAQNYIEEKGLVVNYLQHIDLNRKFKNGFRR